MRRRLVFQLSGCWSDPPPAAVQAYVDKAQGEEELMEAKRVAAALRMREAQALAAVEAARQAAAEAAERERQQASSPAALTSYGSSLYVWPKMTVPHRVSSSS